MVAASQFKTTSTLFHLPFFAGKKRDCFQLLADVLQKASSKPFIVFTPNPEQVMRAHKNPLFGGVLREADLVLPDGVGVVAASKMLSSSNEQISERISGTETVAFLMAEAAQSKLPVFLLGGRSASRAYAEKLRALYPTLKVEWDEGAQNIRAETTEESSRVAQKIQMLKPAIVLVAYGAPFQEQWVLEHLDMLKEARVRLVMVVGGAFEILSGTISPAPAVFTQLGLEWLWRLLQEPWRWKRQLALIEFMFLVGKTKLSGKQ